MDYARYLLAKRTVDDRALNLNVLNEFESHIQNAVDRNSTQMLRVIEVGAGVGDMFHRLWRRKALFSAAKSIHYILLDIKPELLKSARQSIESNQFTDGSDMCANRTSLYLSSSSITDGSGVHHEGCVDGGEVEDLEDLQMSEYITVSFVVGDALKYLESRRGCFDVLIGAAVLDLWELQSATQILLNALDISAGVGAFYFPINFDGTTSFYPESCEGYIYDRHVQDRYHFAMGLRKVNGKEVPACHTGRLLVPTLQGENATVTAGGSSWIVHPDSDGNYECDERFFLRCILDFVESALSNGTDDRSKESDADADALCRYAQCRREQLTEGKLCYLAHNVDVCGHLRRLTNE
ncbi:S-adenosyl-L-methionine-dependent methyltransferase [Gracilaria domingensis]|nr:S-adenosyl-L-methionine-dependent methyltransferase [Gracilaria domingensis]